MFFQSIVVSKPCISSSCSLAVIFFLVNCAAPGTTFEELDQIQIDEAIAIIKNTELDKPVERPPFNPFDPRTSVKNSCHP